MKDKFKDHVHGIDSIPSNAEVIVPSDTVDLPHVCRRIHIGTGGDLTVDCKELGSNITFKNLASGIEKVGAFTRVYTATTATDLIAEW